MARAWRAALLAGVLGCSDGPPPDAVDSALSYLFAAQHADGTWKSAAYGSGVLGSGRALTPFLLASISPLEDARLRPHRDAVDRALQAVLRGAGEPSEYPNYARALSILALRRFRPEGWEKHARKLARELADKQIHGAWDFGLEALQRPDISVTAFVLEALAAQGELGDGAREAALLFVGRLQAEDGGFFFTTEPAQNKAGPGRAYASATADAIRALRACGVPEDDPRVARALEWLRLNPSLDHVAGVPLETEGDPGKAMQYYALFARARAGPVPGLREKLAALQNEDGSWRNANGLMKEDDPLVATGLALWALGASAP